MCFDIRSFSPSYFISVTNQPNGSMIPCGSIRSGTCCGEPYMSRRPSLRRPSTRTPGAAGTGLAASEQCAGVSLGELARVFDVAVALVGLGEHQRQRPALGGAKRLSRDCSRRSPSSVSSLRRDEILFVVAAFEVLRVGQHHHPGTSGQQRPNRRITAVVLGFFGKGISCNVREHHFYRLSSSPAVKLTMHPVPVFGVARGFFGKPTGRQRCGRGLLQ